MSVKWGRNYQLCIQRQDGQIQQINYPLTLEFNIVRQPCSSTNTGTFRIYNLSPDTRQAIYRDRYDWNTSRSLTLAAGYGNAPLPFIFKGKCYQAYSWRESGRVDYITEIMGNDMFTMVTAFSNTTLQGNQPKQTVVNNLLTNLTNADSNVGVGYIAPVTGSYPRGRTLFGPTWPLLQQETGKNAFIDNGLIHVLSPNEYFVGGITVIDSSTGLLSTPKKAESWLTVEILFEPNINIGQQIQLSSSYTVYNGLYKVMGLEHRGIISGAVNGKCTTKLFLLIPPAKWTQIINQGLSQVPNG